ncbi:MAG: extracellular solute-binding protein [Oscillospiraceae bacterium]|jgi:hypothetical protein|nr:extracellular solute-binding protein [Oscillospiraceae bacterium]
MKTTKILSLILCFALVLGLTAACADKSPAGDSDPNSDTPNNSNQSDRVTIRVAEYGTGLDNARPEDDRIKKYIEDKLNINLEYVSFDDSVWDETIDTNLMAGMGFDVFHNWAQQESTTRWVNGNVIVPVGDLVNADPGRYPVLNKLFNSPDYKMFSTSLTGSETVYGVLALAFSRWYAGTLTYNKKILNEAGFTEAPKNLAEFMQYGKAAAEKGYTAWWPRNGKLTSLEEMDKIVAYPMGTSIRANEGGVTLGMVQTGTDTWKSVTVSDASREAIRVLNGMYNDGTLPMGIGTEEDFGPILDQWDNDKIGAISYFVSSGAQYAWTLNDRYKKVRTDATYEDLIVGPMIQAEDGSYPKQYDIPFWLGAYTMISSGCKTPDRALDYLEFLGSAEGQNLIFKGIEGVHYTEENGKVTFNTEEWKNENVMYGFDDGRCYYPWGSFFYNAMSRWTPWETSSASWFDIYKEEHNYTDEWTGLGVSPEVAYGNEITDQNRANVFVDLPSYYALVSFTEEELAIRANLKALVDEYVPAFITGKKNLDGDWDEYVQKYTDAGVAKVEAGLNSAIAAARAKFEAAK